MSVVVPLGSAITALQVMFHSFSGRELTHGQALTLIQPSDNPLSAIARVCHEANRAYCNALGDYSQLSWESAPEWQQQSAIAGVQFIADNPNALPSASHENWLAVKKAEGWKYGPLKDPEKKEHPCYVPYDELPAEQKAKDYIFGAIARALLTGASL